MSVTQGRDPEDSVSEKNALPKRMQNESGIKAPPGQRSSSGGQAQFRGDVGPVHGSTGSRELNQGETGEEIEKFIADKLADGEIPA